MVQKTWASAAAACNCHPLPSCMLHMGCSLQRQVGMQAKATKGCRAGRQMQACAYSAVAVCVHSTRTGSEVGWGSSAKHDARLQAQADFRLMQQHMRDHDGRMLAGVSLQWDRVWFVGGHLKSTSLSLTAAEMGSGRTAVADDSPPTQAMIKASPQF